MVSLDLFLFHEFGLTSLTNVQSIKYQDWNDAVGQFDFQISAWSGPMEKA